jgi:radical SAM superfamily enzyme YgiQ (UPF0313 family)
VEQLKILLISPSSHDDIISRAVTEIPYMDSSAFFAPHALAAVAALTPLEHHIFLHDEHMHGPVDNILLGENFDIIGLSLITNQLTRTLAISEMIRSRNIKGILVIGGIGTSNVIQSLKNIADVIFIGEAEETWPAFLNDFKNGSSGKIYQHISKPDMQKTPIPRWDLIKNDIPRYGAVSVQTSRGCPHDCSFCDVIYTYGRKVRSKSTDQVIQEIENIMQLGARMIMIADDNFTANRSYAKEILKKLKKLNNAQKMPLSFMTQVDVTVAQDDELLELLADCNFFELQIGIESFDEESLKHMNKKQNMTIDIKKAIRKIQSYGIAVQSHLIIGTDADDLSTFKKTAEFLKEVNITHHSCHPLMAPPGTKLWYELKRLGRLVETNIRLRDQLDITSNIVPKNMTRIEMMEGMAHYWETVSSVDHYLPRALGFINGINRKPDVREPGFLELWKIKGMIFGVFKYYIMNAGKEHRIAFFKLFQTASKIGSYLVPKVIFLYTRFMMDRIRDHNASIIARSQALYEKTHPDGIKLMTTDVPISQTIRESYKEIFKIAYEHIIPHVKSHEELYRLVLESMIDYTDRFNDSFENINEIEREHIKACCDRIISDKLVNYNHENKTHFLERIPPGFEREILNALDNNKRCQSGKMVS